MTADEGRTLSDLDRDDGGLRSNLSSAKRRTASETARSERVDFGDRERGGFGTVEEGVNVVVCSHRWRLRVVHREGATGELVDCSDTATVGVADDVALSCEGRKSQFRWRRGEERKETNHVRNRNHCAPA